MNESQGLEGVCHLAKCYDFQISAAYPLDQRWVGGLAGTKMKLKYSQA